ncbi:MAG: RpiB/LacA/LacB family sugar-phosphate isomerase [Bacteroidales bacterium]|nr:RpiB/LacA/LacB family sugar-phosphate isomerase [Bacteroidales bacterium]
MTIGICNDHTAVEYKVKLVAYLRRKGHEVVNFGTDSTDSCDYPDYAHQLGAALESGKVDAGIAMCGTGNGMAMCLNHYKGVRAGLAWTVPVAHVVKEHNNANVLVMPARFVSYRMVVSMTREWLTTGFAGGRHKRRIDKIEI